MSGFFRKNHGAVTVIVTLLLIPAVLITGTGVDVARIYTARATLQDANQLALNSVLTEYDALLQDLYGLYAVTQTDETLAKMVNEYIEKTVFASDADQEGTGVLKLFYGAKPEAKLTAGEEQNLGDTEQLRRQIEEYAKIRVPVVLVKELLDRLDEFKKVKADAAVIDKKTAVEKRIDSIDAKYREIYTAIKAVSNFGAGEEKTLDDIYGGLTTIRTQFHDMKEVRDSFKKVSAESGSNDMLEQLEDHYDDLALNVVAITMGPSYGSDWEEDTDDPSEGEFTLYTAFSLGGVLLDGSDKVESYSKLAEKLNTLCKEANDAKKALKDEIDSLEKELNKGECSDTLKNGLTESSNGEKPLLEQYKDLVRFDLERLGNEYMGSGGAQLDSFKALMDKLYASEIPLYETGTAETGFSLTYDVLKNKSNLLSRFDLNYQGPPINPGPDLLKRAADMWPLAISNPGGGYKNFQETSDDHKAFYDELEKMYGGDQQYGTEEEKKNKEDNVKGSILAVFDAVKGMYSEIYPDPEGAYKLTNTVGTSKAPTGSDFCGKDSDWGDTDKVASSLQKSLNTDIISKLGDIAGDAADKMLLLGYATEMFSCYSTGRGSDQNPVNMAGIPLSPDVNYFYQSELEYIYNGNDSDAIANLNSLGSMILLTRFVLNYIVSFNISSVNEIVEMVKGALAFLGPIAIAVGGLARLGLALGESFTDLSRLRGGYKVALLKNNESWRFSLTGLANMTAEAAKNAAKQQVENASSGDSNVLDDDNGLYYADYVRAFLLFVDGDQMAERVGKLIAINITNKKENIGKESTREAREQAMATKEICDLSKAYTGFSLTSSAEMNMLFLALPLAQNGIEGVASPKTLTVQVTDYRGY